MSNKTVTLCVVSIMVGSGVPVSSFVVFFFGGSISRSVVTGSLFFFEELLGIFEGLLKSSVKGVVSLLSGVSFLLSSLGSLGLEGSSSLGVSVSLSLLGKLGSLLEVWVESLHLDLVLEWVWLGLEVDSSNSLLSSQFGLNLVRVNDSSEVSAGHHVSVEVISALLG